LDQPVVVASALGCAVAPAVRSSAGALDAESEEVQCCLSFVRGYHAVTGLRVLDL
jgi:hypothetical protein